MEQLSDYLERVVHAVRRHVSGCDEVGVTIVTAGRPHTAAYTTVQTLEIDARAVRARRRAVPGCRPHRRENRVDDLVVDDGRWPAFAKECREDGLAACCAAARQRPGVRGGVNLYGWAPNAFDAFDASLVRVAASRCADAVVAVSTLDGVQRLAGQLEQAMASRAVIEQAKGVIMALRGLPEHAAFEVLRTTSQARNIKVRDLAHQIVTGVVTREEPGRA